MNGRPAQAAVSVAFACVLLWPAGVRAEPSGDAANGAADAAAGDAANGGDIKAADEAEGGADTKGAARTGDAAPPGSVLLGPSAPGAGVTGKAPGEEAKEAVKSAAGARNPDDEAGDDDDGDAPAEE